jgi:hypothetical protein
VVVVAAALGLRHFKLAALAAAEMAALSPATRLCLVKAAHLMGVEALGDI